MRVANKALACLFVASGAVSCITANADLQDVEIERQNLTFPAGPTDASVCSSLLTAQLSSVPGVPAMLEYQFPSQTFDVPVASLPLPSGAAASLDLKEITVRSHDHTSISFLRFLKVTLSAPHLADNAPQTLIERAISEPGKLVNEIIVPVSDVVIELNPDQLEPYLVSVTATAGCENLPPKSWAVDVLLRLSGNAQFQY